MVYESFGFCIKYEDSASLASLIASVHNYPTKNERHLVWFNSAAWTRDVFWSWEEQKRGGEKHTVMEVVCFICFRKCSPSWGMNAKHRRTRGYLVNEYVEGNGGQHRVFSKHIREMTSSLKSHDLSSFFMFLQICRKHTRGKSFEARVRSLKWAK